MRTEQTNRPEATDRTQKPFQPTATMASNNLAGLLRNAALQAEQMDTLQENNTRLQQELGETQREVLRLQSLQEEIDQVRGQLEEERQQRAKAEKDRQGEQERRVRAESELEAWRQWYRTAPGGTGTAAAAAEPTRVVTLESRHVPTRARQSRIPRVLPKPPSVARRLRARKKAKEGDGDDTTITDEDLPYHARRT